MNTQESGIQLSVVATIYNCSATITTLVDEITQYAGEIGVDYEIILVDDASRDDSAELLESLCTKNPRLKCVFLSKNHGQQLAMSAGIHHAKGDYVIIMDGDLQNPTSAIVKLYEMAREDMDIVYCVSTTRNSKSDELSSKMLWFVLSKIFRVSLVPNQLMMRIMNRRAVDKFIMYNERVRTIGGITHDIGMKYSSLEVENRKRTDGKGNYSLLSRLNLSLDFLLELSNHPLNVLIYLGLFTLVLTIFLAVYYLYMYFSTDVLPGFTSVILSIFFFGSVQVLIFGVIARYLSNIYMEVRRRPLFLIQRTLNLDNK